MSSNNYWRKREEEALKQYIKEEAEYDKQIQRIYSDMLDSCNKEINAFYGKYAKAEGITLAEAKKRVSKLDIAEYERKAARYVKDASLDRKANGGKTNKKGYYFSEKANEEMRLYNLTMKVNRLEMLKANIGLEMIKGHAELESFMGDILKGRTEAELVRQAGILGKTVRNNAQLAHAIPNASFHNATFSDRVWMYHDVMKADLEKLLTSGLIQGKNPRQLARELEKYVKGDAKGGAKFNAERLMRTELARVQTEAQKQSFERNGFEEYEFIANSNCCDICKANDGKHFKVSKMMPGENAAPMHPHCRCSAAAYSDRKEYDEWLDYLEKGGTTEEYNKLKVRKVNNVLTKKNADGAKIKMLADINKMLTPYERKVLNAVPKKEGFFDVAAHGAVYAIEYGSESMMLSARELARIIQHNKDYKGEKIRLLSCSTGSADDGFAQQLANALGVEVEAPSDVLFVYPNGTYKIGYDNSGKMKIFKPYRKG